MLTYDVFQVDNSHFDEIEDQIKVFSLFTFVDGIISKSFLKLVFEWHTLKHSTFLYETNCH